MSPDEQKARDAWHEAMKQVPLPKKGCFEAVYPNKEWKEVQCKPAPNYPQPPHRGPQPFVVGAGSDVAPKAPSGFISSTSGTFTTSGVTSESGPIANSGPSIANAYTLQINTNFFNSTACAGATNPACQGWQQFVFENNGTSGGLYIQYWLAQYSASCPVGQNCCPAGQNWNQTPVAGFAGFSCWKNDSMGAAGVTNQPITNLANLKMTGSVSATGDQNILYSGGTKIGAVTGDNAVNAAAGWQIAEFNVFGDGGNSSGGSQASFNSGSTITPRTQIIYGGTAPPICTTTGYTAESNNLNFGPNAPMPSPPGPAIIFNESSSAAIANCMAATSIGDTHLRTQAGMFYDFQAAGDFVLLQSEPDFVVQTRQVSGAPNWPNADVNHAVATQMGKSRVAVCLAPTRLNVDGKNTDLADGAALATPDGVTVARRGNVYFIMSESGDSVRAEVNPTWINVSVGLGHWPAKISGLLANPNGNPNQLGLRNGTVLNNPYAFQDLYHGYADSWRVAPEESLLAACSERETEHGVAAKPFYAADLEPKLAERTRAVCQAAGVKQGALLDACALDVAVIGDDQAAKVFVDMPEPAAVGKFTGGGGPDLAGLLKKWWWLLVVIIVILLALLLMRRK